ncbi:DUF4132 domain-containing protein [Haloferula sp.]|uniref:DUF4132 domain-containing protein n=1 Tax=Haloferula sp. TaxID=2497595 RepID=UPI003C78C25E
MNTDLQAALDKLKDSQNAAFQDIHAVIEAYRESADPADAVLKPFNGYSFDLNSLEREVARYFTTDRDASAIASLILLNLGKGAEEHPLVEGFMGRVLGEEGVFQNDHNQVLTLARAVGVDEVTAASGLALWSKQDLDYGWIEDSVPEGIDFSHPLERYFQELDDQVLGEVLAVSRKGKYNIAGAPDKMIATFAIHRPEVLGPWISRVLEGKHTGSPGVWMLITRGTERWDKEMLEAALKLPPTECLTLILHLSRNGRVVDPEMIRAVAIEKDQTKFDDALKFLAAEFPDEFIPHFKELHLKGRLIQGYGSQVHDGVFQLVAERWSNGGAELFDALLELPPERLSGGYRNYVNVGKLLEKATIGLVASLQSVGFNPARDWVLRAQEYLGKGKATPIERSDARVAVWQAVAELAKQPFVDDFRALLGSKSKSLRAVAIDAISSQDDPKLISEVIEQYRGGKVDERIGLCELLESLADVEHAELLKEMLVNEDSDKVRDAIQNALLECGGSSTEATSAEPGNMDEVLTEIRKHAKKTKLPKSTWLDAGALPALKYTDGRVLSEEVVTFLIAKQSKHKVIEAAPDVVSLLVHIDRASSKDFALKLVEGFLDSEQAAADRWALTLGGLLGDQRIIPPLLSRIQGWCENSRHKLAEYAAQAISLLPGDEPLMVLDTLATRYRSKFKNVGKACAAAFEAAAVARGITPDELGDMVVPSFEFDEEGVRRFEWDGGGISAELSPDFKLQWFDEESEKSWKSMPKTVPDDVKAEVKVLNKMIRETVKGQTARLELMLVRQRRWPVARWLELFEEHPLLKSFASRLVWSIYSESGSLFRTFRRYPNGLLANAAGELEEIPETDVSIGMVHPLELNGELLQDWRDHLSRMKVKPPFPQLDRPLELLDPLHGNRKEITVSRDKEVGAGTFRSRTDKLGWVRGSVIDAGGISSVYKSFPGAGIEVVLPTSNFWIGIDPMDTVELSSAYFVKEGTVGRGSYEYDEPGPDDPRVLRFDQVPAIVYSETVADLKVIVGSTD